MLSAGCASDSSSDDGPTANGSSSTNVTPQTSASASASPETSATNAASSGGATNQANAGGSGGGATSSSTSPSAEPTNSTGAGGAGGAGGATGAGGAGGAGTDQGAGGNPEDDPSGAGGASDDMSDLGAGGQPDTAMNEADGGPPMLTEPEAGSEPPEEASSASAGCGTEPTLESSASSNTVAYNTVTSGGTERRYILRLPENYDSAEPHRLILGFHGAGDNPTNVAGNPAFFGLYDLAEGSTIFIAPEAVGGLWSDTNDVVFVDDILEQVEADLCIDTSRIIVQGFSQGGAMARLLACERPGRFRAAIANSAGGLPMPASCDPIPFLGSLGLQESGGGGQAGQTDFFATANGCTVEAHPAAPGGDHLCSEYQACMDGFPVVWCSYDGGHTPLPNDAGQNSSWMPERVWEFVSQF